MSAPFAAAARRLAGHAARAFGWSPDLFWQVTPAELASAFGMEEAADTAPLSRVELDLLIERECYDR